MKKKCHEKKQFIVHHVTLLECHAFLSRKILTSIIDVMVYITRNSEVFFSLIECVAYQYLVGEPLLRMIASILLFIDAIVLSIKV